MLKIKKEKGITLLVLIITIIILMILASVSIYIATGDLNNAVEKKNKVEIEIVAEAVKEQYIKYLATGNVNLLYGTQYSGSEISINSGETIIKNQGSWKTLSDVDLKSLGIEEQSDTVYIVKYETGEVYDSTNKIYKGVSINTKISDTSSNIGYIGDPSSKEIIKDDSLILYYDCTNNTGDGFDSTATTWTDLSGNQKDGEIIGATWQQNTGLHFDGDNDWVKIDSIRPNNTDTSKKISEDEFTIECVMEYSELGKEYMYSIANVEAGGVGITSKRTSDCLYRNSINIYDTSDFVQYSDENTIKIEQKYHLLISYSKNNKVKYYINGEKVVEEDVRRNKTYN